MARDEARRKKREQKQRVSGSSYAPAGEDVPSRTVTKYKLPPQLSKSKVLEIIQKPNASGEVIIPVFILKDEIDRRLTTDEMLQLHLDVERSDEKLKMFELLKARLVTAAEKTTPENSI